MYRLQNNSATNWTFHSLKLAEVFSFVNDTSYYKTDGGVRCPISTALSPTIMTNVGDVTWDQRRAMRLWNQNWFIQLPGCSHISLNPVSPGQESLVPHLGTSYPSWLPWSKWRTLVEEMPPRGPVAWSQAGEGNLARCQTYFGKNWQAVGGTSENGELQALTASKLALATAFALFSFERGLSDCCH